MSQNIRIFTEGEIDRVPDFYAKKTIKLLAASSEENTIDVYCGIVEFHKDLIKFRENIGKVLGGCNLGVTNDRLTFFGDSLDYGQLPENLHYGVVEAVRKELQNLGLKLPNETLIMIDSY